MTRKPFFWQENHFFFDKKSIFFYKKTIFLTRKPFFWQENHFFDKKTIFLTRKPFFFFWQKKPFFWQKKKTIFVTRKSFFFLQENHFFLLRQFVMGLSHRATFDNTLASRDGQFSACLAPSTANSLILPVLNLLANLRLYYAASVFHYFGLKWISIPLPYIWWSFHKNSVNEHVEEQRRHWKNVFCRFALCFRLAICVKINSKISF